MDRLIELLNKMKVSGIISNYAIGGATALVYYFEPINTQDIDVFTVLNSKNDVLVNLSPIYDFLKKEKCKFEKEFVLIQNIPVQFLVPYNELLTEAVEKGKYVSYGRKKIRIFDLEYLMAIMIQTGRLKDKARLSDLVLQKIKFDAKKLNTILKKFSLYEKWLELKETF
ncbi:MAG: hypothetical protein ABIA04_08480 [Pseudomonadota bacterium]